MKTIVAALALALSALPLAANAEELRGTVLDLSSRPVAGATVTVTFADGKDVATNTDPLGRFTLDAAARPLRLRVQRTGYDVVTLSAEALAAAQAQLRIVLIPRLQFISSHRGWGWSACGAFQPQQTIDTYRIVPGHCGMPLVGRGG